MTKIQSFLQTAHTIWMTDALSMDEYMDFLDVYMLRHDVKWKNEGDLDAMLFIRTVEMNYSTEDLFAYDVNTMAHDNFTVFGGTCSQYMDFSKMQKEERRAA